MTKLEKQLFEIAEPIVEYLGFTLWGLETVSAGKKQVVRIYIDKEDGVNIDQCADVSKSVSLALEVDDVMTSAFNLEVSSPGFERRFFNPAQMGGYIGQNVEVKLEDALDGRKNFRGELKSIGEDDLTIIDADKETFTLDWDAVKKATLVYEF
ncbi:MAG: ribosome maturation factor RimP [Desulfovibrio sp.]